jgi:hypothetical protein
MKTLFTELFGRNPELRTLDFLLIHRNYDYSLTEIARNAGVGWTTINLFWKGWIRKGFVLKTRRIGRAQLYELNKKNAFVKEVMALHDKVLRNFLADEISKQKSKTKNGFSEKSTAVANA